MDAEKRKLRIGHRINQIADEKLPFLFDLKILAAERNNFCRRFLARRAHEPVGMKPAAGDDEFRAETSGGSFDDLPAAVRNNFQDSRVESDFAAGFADEFAEFFANAGIIHDALLRDVNRGDAGGVRLDFLDLLRIQFPQTEQAVGISAFPEIFESRQFFLGSGDDDFAALFVGDAVLRGRTRPFRAGR